MKRACAAAVLLVALGVVAEAQTIHGTPPSVTSLGGTKSMVVPPGIPASVTSFGPSIAPCTNPALIPAALGCTDPAFTPTINFSTGTVEFGRTFNLRPRRHRRPVAFPVYVPYGVPVYPAYPGTAYDTGPAAVVESEEEEPPAPTIFEHRPRSERPLAEANRDEDSRYGAHYLDARERKPKRRDPEPEPAAIEASPTQAPRDVNPVVLIFRDGHEQEVRNYAIMGDTLYDLGTFVAHKIKLAELDLKATLKANEDRGVDFSVPAGYKVN